MGEADVIEDERQHQRALITWANNARRAYPELRWLYATPNAGKRLGKAGALMVAEGLRKGVPDLTLPVPRGGYHGLYIELKRPGRYAVAPEQKEWLEGLRQNGYRAEIAVGWDAARELIVEYLEAA